MRQSDASGSHGWRQDLRSVDEIARQWVRDEPAFLSSLDFGRHVRQGRGPGPAVFIGDQVGIALFTPEMVGRHDHRMALLARPGDMVVVRHREPEFETYLAECLGIHSVTFLEADEESPVSVAMQCRTKPHLKGKLQRLLSMSGSITVYAYIVNGHVWRMAEAIGMAEDLPVYISGPAPRISRRANNKLWFWSIAREVLGQDATPPTLYAFGPAAAAGLVARLARTTDRVVVKVPSSAGAVGNVRLESDQIAGMNLAEIRDLLEHRLRVTGWTGGYPVLVGVWESGVVNSPSVQLWLPHPEDGGPNILGIFEQRVAGAEGEFVGARFARQSANMENALHDGAARLGAVFQRLGYYGPCSFDSVLRRTSTGAEEIHWIECNGRWSGVSIPLAAATAILGARPKGLVIVQENFPGVAALRVSELRTRLDELLFVSGSTREGVMLISPPEPGAGISFNAMAVAASQVRAEELMQEAFRRLRVET